MPQLIEWILLVLHRVAADSKLGDPDVVHPIKYSEEALVVIELTFHELHRKEASYTVLAATRAASAEGSASSETQTH